MNDEHLEELLRTTLERDAARVPLTRPEWDAALSLQSVQTAPPRQARSAKLARPLMAAACLLLVAVAVVALLTTGSDRDLMVGSAPPDGGLSRPTTTLVTGATTTTVIGHSTGTTSPGPASPSSTTIHGGTSTTVDGMPPVTTIAPPVTLPATGDGHGVPETVPGVPTTYYRFAPDLDLAWSDRDGSPELCWRTPIDQRCVAHPEATDPASTVIIPSSSQHAMILVFSGLGRAGGPSALDIELNGGEVSSVPVAWSDPQLDIGIARIAAPARTIARVIP